MEASLLTTKLTIPPLRSPLISRPRLVERCRKALVHSLTLVSAPAGFGKTTLLRDWVDRREVHLPVAWLSLDEADNDPVRFWRHFIAAVRTLPAEAGTTSLELLGSGRQTPIHNILIELLNDLAPITTDFFLVLDDYHFIDAPAIHDSMAFFLEHLPTRMHIIISTRVDPPLPLPRLRGRGQLQDIRADDLRFTPEEITELENALQGPALKPEQLDALSTRTEGWAAGLKMAMLSLRDRPDTAGFLTDFTASPRYIMDYLIEEVLQRQPEVTRDFLLKTSILDRLSGPLCDAVTGRTDGRGTLRRLEKENLFIVPLDGSYEWFRYEHLFGDLLRHQLESDCDAATIEELQKRASRWYEGNGYIENAMSHARAARDWERVMDLTVASDALRVYGGLTVYQWLNPVPRELLLTNARASLILAWALVMTGRVMESKELVDTFEKSAAYGDTFASGVATIRTYIGVATLDPSTERYAELALAKLPAENLRQRATVSFLLGLHYSNHGRYIKAEPLFRAASELHRSIGDTYSLSADLGMLAIVVLIQEANVFKAEQLLKEAISLAEKHPETALAYCHLGLLYYVLNQLDKASVFLEKSLSLHPGNMEILTATYFYTILVRLAQGKVDEAEHLLNQAEELINKRGGNAKLQARIAGYHIALAVAKDDMNTAYRWLDRFAEYEDVFVCDAPVDAMRLLHERWGPAIEEKMKIHLENYLKTDLKFYLMPALTEQALVTSDSDKASDYFAQALAIGKPYGFIRPFVNWGTTLIPLLRKTIKRNIEPAYARELLDIIEEEERQRQVRLNGVAVTPTPGPLSDREIEVLHLVADGISNPKIADRLSISLATVKTHLHHIIDKLEVKDRSQAVYRAKELNLL